jgi:hypothetical protein
VTHLDVEMNENVRVCVFVCVFVLHRIQPIPAMYSTAFRNCSANTLSVVSDVGVCFGVGRGEKMRGRPWNRAILKRPLINIGVTADVTFAPHRFLS